MEEVEAPPVMMYRVKQQNPEEAKVSIEVLLKIESENVAQAPIIPKKELLVYRKKEVKEAKQADISE